MPILNINTEFVGQVNVLPRVICIQTNDTYDEITTAGYLNKAVAQGFTVSPIDIALVSGTNVVNNSAGANWFQVVISGDSQPYTYSLAAITAYA